MFPNSVLWISANYIKPFVLLMKQELLATTGGDRVINQEEQSNEMDNEASFEFALKKAIQVGGNNEGDFEKSRQMV